MKKLVAIIGLLIAAGGGTWYYYNYGRPKEKPTVVTTPVSKADIVEAVVATGSLEALRTVQVGSQVSGVVKSLMGVDFNSIVKKDQVIAQIDPSLLQVQVDIAKANLDKQQGDIDQTKVELENDNLNLERDKQLFAKQLINQQALEAQELQVKSRQASIDSAIKSMKQTEAQLQSAELNVKYCTITSPVDGVVVARNVDEGQTVQSSMSVATFFTIATDLTNLKLTAMVDESEIGKVRRGMEVRFTVDSYGKEEFVGIDAEPTTLSLSQSSATGENYIYSAPGPGAATSTAQGVHIDGQLTDDAGANTLHVVGDANCGTIIQV